MINFIIKRPVIWAIAIGIFIYSLPVSDCIAQTVTELLRSGSNGSKRNLVIIGDGFQAADQNTFNTIVNNFIFQGVFSDDVFRETMNAFNIYRINVDSTDSGVTQVDANGNVTTARNTALDYRYSGDWNRCWMEPGPNSNALINNLLNAHVPQRDYIFIILNEPGGGGCRRGDSLAVTTSSNWTTVAHEMGHMVGNLGDEYTGGNTNYTGAEPGKANLTIETDRDNVKWKCFIDPKIPVTTTCTDVADTSQDIGIFEGATIGSTRYRFDLYRPSCNDRMNSNAPAFCSVCYNRIHTVLDPFHDYTYQKSYKGDFNGDGKDDLVLHNSNSLALYLSKGSELEAEWVVTGEIPLWDDFQPGDKFYVADFNNDGKDDLYVFNHSDWSIPYFAMLRSTGSGFECIRRFDLELPGWDDMRQHDQFFVGDFNNDQKDDLYVFNSEDWSMGYLELLASTGTTLRYIRRYDEELPGWDDMKKHDQFFVGDFNDDQKDDLYVFNGRDWSTEYLEMLKSTGTSLVNTRRYDGSVPGWDGLEPNDRFYVADVNGDDKDDLYVYNANDWATEYLGILKSSGSSLSGSWQSNWINSWNLGQVDKFLVANFNGGADWDDLFVFNNNWFGMLRSHRDSVQLNSIYPDWIHNHNYHCHGWW